MARRIAILGAGILGSSAALFLARRGFEVTLFDAAECPFSGASRWNEGKIHLGFIYAGDPSLATARKVLPGGLRFKPLVESLIGRSLEGATTATDDTYLVHPESVAPLEAAEAYFRAVADLVREEPDAGGYLVDVRGCRAERLSPAELEACADPRTVLAGLRVPERSVDTNWVADRFVEALEAEPRIRLAMGTRVTGLEGAFQGPWKVLGSEGADGPFDGVINALWEGRLAIDRSLGLLPSVPWTHRYRLSLFAHTEESIEAPSAIVSVGPFGDLKNYTGHDFYLSWYPAGLVAQGGDVEPPALPTVDPEALSAAILENLARYIPAAARIGEKATRMTLAGGWVFAHGQGSLADPAATLHRRDRIGIQQHGTYFSIDTGKYSIAPWLAEEVAARIAGA